MKGAFFLWSLMLSQKGANHIFLFFHMAKTDSFWPKRGPSRPWPNGPPKYATAWSQVTDCLRKHTHCTLNCIHNVKDGMRDKLQPSGIPRHYPKWVGTSTTLSTPIQIFQISFFDLVVWLYYIFRGLLWLWTAHGTPGGQNVSGLLLSFSLIHGGVRN